jgi:hypothetical protein
MRSTGMPVMHKPLISRNFLACVKSHGRTLTGDVGIVGTTYEPRSRESRGCAGTFTDTGSWTQTLCNRSDYPESTAALHLFLPRSTMPFTSLAARHGKNDHYSGIHSLRIRLFQKKNFVSVLRFGFRTDRCRYTFLPIFPTTVFDARGGPACWNTLCSLAACRASR